ncbi:MAG: transketolase [Actinobacteria bacterium]|nr:transketolase [Actinomycetota bacterium]
MRAAFARTLLELAEEDPRVWLVVGDVGFGVVEPFRERFPDRYLNVGVAEANLAGVSAGLALSGALPFMYSIANFPTLRCLEQIRNDICYNGANVKIVAVGAGFAYGSLGATHHATEDVAVMRALPGMTVVAPADPVETVLAIRAAHKLVGPVYLRIGRSGDPQVHLSPPEFSLGRAIRVLEGSDVTIIATGGITHSVLTASERLGAQGISARVLSMHTLKPIDRLEIKLAAEETGGVITVEEHSIVGGLGSAVAQVIVEEGLCPRRFRCLALPDAFGHRIGSREYLLESYGLSPNAIADIVRETLRRRTSA